MILKTILLTFLLSFNQIMASEYLPEVIYQLDERFAHHVLVVEKSTHTLYLYKNSDGKPQLFKTYKIATGKITGDKEVQGDKKTPEGIYFFNRFRPGSELVSSYGKQGLIYGAGAFTMNYPNIIDRIKGKTGGGIWLHSTDDDNRVSKGLDSKGCVVATDADIKDISQYIDIENTPIIVTQNLRFLSYQAWETNKNNLLGTIEKWASAWKTKDFNTYINQYSRTNFYSKTKGGYNSYKRYKRRVFARKDKPEIIFRNISVLNFNHYAVITLEQDYSSATINDIGKKVLYLERNDKYQWKIISEGWEKINPEYISFVPSLKYFPTTIKKASNDSGSL